MGGAATVQHGQRRRLHGLQGAAMLYAEFIVKRKSRQSHWRLPLGLGQLDVLPEKQCEA